MKIELKNIHYYERLSEETNAFTASIYVDEKNAGTASNDGHGGNTDIHHNSEAGRELLRKAEEFCKTLPEVKSSIAGQSYPMDLELYIDNLLEEYLNKRHKQKFQQKIDRAMSRSILVSSDGLEYRLYQMKTPFKELLAKPDGKDLLIRQIEKYIKPKMGEDEKIYNTNIPEEVFISAGLSKEQYISEEKTNRVKQRRGKKL